MIRLISLIERQVPTPKFRLGSDIIDFIDNKVPEWKKYKIKGALWNDRRYSIPFDLVHKTFGWTEKFIDGISNKLVPYEGWIGVYKGNVEVGGNAE